MPSEDETALKAFKQRSLKKSEVLRYKDDIMSFYFSYTYFLFWKVTYEQSLPPQHHINFIRAT